MRGSANTVATNKFYWLENAKSGDKLNGKRWVSIQPHSRRTYRARVCVLCAARVCVFIFATDCYESNQWAIDKPIPGRLFVLFVPRTTATGEKGEIASENSFGSNNNNENMYFYDMIAMSPNQPNQMEYRIHTYVFIMWVSFMWRLTDGGRWRRDGRNHKIAICSNT